MPSLIDYTILELNTTYKKFLGLKCLKNISFKHKVSFKKKFRAKNFLRETQCAPKILFKNFREQRSRINVLNRRPDMFKKKKHLISNLVSLVFSSKFCRATALQTKCRVGVKICRLVSKNLDRTGQQQKKNKILNFYTKGKIIS